MYSSHTFQSCIVIHRGHRHTHTHRTELHGIEAGLEVLAEIGTQQSEGSHRIKNPERLQPVHKSNVKKNVQAQGRNCYQEQNKQMKQAVRL